MIKISLPFIVLVFTMLMLAACGYAAEPGAGVTSVGAPSSPPDTQTPAPTVSPATPEITPPNPPEAAVSPGQPETGGAATPAPTVAPTATVAAAPAATTGPPKVVPTAEARFSSASMDPQAMMAQIMGSPDIMSCVSAKLGFATMMQLISRSPADDEIALMLPCLGGVEGQTSTSSGATASISALWQERIESTLETKTCTAGSPSGYPSSYYSGPLIDSHLHIPALPDSPFGDFDPPNYSSTGGGVDSALYDAIAPEDRPFLGRTVSIGDIVCSLQAEGTTRAFSFFPVYQDIEVQLIEVAKRTMEAYPTLFVPFIQTSGSQASTVEASIFEGYLTLSPGLFFGQGEVGDSPTEPINPPPD